MAKKAATDTASTKKATKKKATKKKVVDAEGADSAPVKKKKAKKKAKRKTKKAVEDVRLRAYWGVFNHAMKRVALYEYNQRKAAEKRRDDLSPEGKPPHFVQKVKEEIDTAEIVDPDAPVDEKAPVKKATKKKTS